MMLQTSSTPGAQRILELDGLRGIAILLVISFHYINNQLVNAIHPLAIKLAFITSFGWVGVDLFFLLSGFLIGTVLIANKNSKNYFSTFYIRRILRIVPNYYLFLLIFFAVSSISFFASSDFLSAENRIPFWSYFAMVNNIYMAIQENLGNDSLSVTWSIAIEEQFYLVFSVLIYFLRNSALPYVFIFLIIAASVVRFQFIHWIPRYVLLPCRMDSLSLGMLVAYFNVHADIQALANKYLRYIVLIMLIDVLICGVIYLLVEDLGVVKHTLFALFFAGCVVLAITQKTSWFAQVLRNKVLMWIGTVSYSLYLFHYFILGMAHQMGGNRTIGIQSVCDIGITFLALSFSIFLSWLIYMKLESPMVAVGKRFTY